MTLHLIKLCVGADSVEDLEAWIAGRMAEARARGREPEQKHTTRMVPKRLDGLLGRDGSPGGSLYWVIKGVVQCRQRLLDVRPFVDTDGIGRCDLILEPTVILTEPRPRGPFQGWRYLEAKDAPRDLMSRETQHLPPQLMRELATLGLL